MGQEKPVRTRYAPSPTGSPHVGNLRTAIYSWLLAKKHGGQFLARLEDTDRDPARYKPESIAEIEESLRFLGITPDEWWVTGGPYGPYIQSERLDRYREIAEELIARGHAYRCYCTEERLKEMRERQQSGYDRHCRNLSSEERDRCHEAGLSFVVRLAMPLDGHTIFTDLVHGELSFDNTLIDDPVLLKSNGWPTYHLAAMTDDHDMQITHVIRGEDWLPSAPKHVFFYEAMGWERPHFAHAPVIVGPDKKKLSKRHGATQFIDFINAGYLPEALFNFLVLLGWSPGEENRELFTVDELIERFSIEGITNHPAMFDYEKLKWMNGEYIRSCFPDRLLELCLPYLIDAGLVSDPPTESEQAYAARVIPLVAERIKLLSEVVQAAEFFFKEPDAPDDKGRRKWLADERALQILDTATSVVGSVAGDLMESECENAVDRIAESLNIERAPVIHTLRISTTGRTVGPGLFETLAVLGRERIVRRLERAKSWVSTSNEN